MARPQEFDEAAVPDAAIDCFWRRGFEATSMDDLGRSMSLYNAFGDKRALFARPLEHYLDHKARMRLRRLEASFPPKHAIHEFFDDIIERSIDDRERKGCFLVNSGLEMTPHHREVGVIITEQLGEIGAFSEGV
jgi:TetR/AcrR family transcriptional repressor of nem operon